MNTYTNYTDAELAVLLRAEPNNSAAQREAALRFVNLYQCGVIGRRPARVHS